MESIQRVFKSHVAAVALSVSVSLPYAGSAIAQDFDSAGLQNVSHSQNIQPSQLIEDENGVLWFKQGQDGRTKYGLALDLSGDAADAQISMVAVGSPRMAQRVVSLGKQFQGWLESHPDISKVAKVASDNLPNDSGGFVFYVGGIHYAPDENYNGVLKVNEVSEELLSFVARYRGLQERQAALKQPSPQ